MPPHGMSFNAPYPPPLTDKEVEQVLKWRIEHGWTFPTAAPENMAIARERVRIGRRLRLWLEAMGVQPTHEQVRDWVHKRQQQARKLDQ